MSDLQCPATLLVARDGHAAYAHPGLLTDDGGWLTDVGATQMVVLAERLAADPSVRISAVYSSPLARSVQSGRLVSDALGVPHEVVGGLEERAVGELAGQQVGNPVMAHVMHAWTTGDLSAAVPGGEDGYQVVRRARQAMESIADQHRGESVLVLAHRWIMSFVLPRLSHNVLDDLATDHVVPHGVPARVRIDADGWVLDEWPGHRRA
ncbi:MULTISPECIES: histidine phosphatase family protein [Arsenicicoccus]|uniref:histidine phosphatase family protein n=1 Tax=Arsenicicoccus TaxID=267408 RepID=UPI00257B13D9|nr:MULTISPECIES: histidine phosphatase family protein [Arsenicicoccus]